jgi:hypothetical protein
MSFETGSWSPHDEDENFPLDVQWEWIDSGKYGYWQRASVPAE